MRIDLMSVVLGAVAAAGIAQPAKAAETCKAGPYVVYFKADSDEVTAKSKEVLDYAAKEIAGCGDVQVNIAGHTDTKRSGEYNVGLSQRMAANVRSYLAEQEVKDGLMITQAFGESRLAVPTKDEVSEGRNRRVEITVGAGSGW